MNNNCALRLNSNIVVAVLLRETHSKHFIHYDIISVMGSLRAALVIIRMLREKR